MVNEPRKGVIDDVGKVAHAGIDTVQGLKDMFIAMGLTGVAGLNEAFDNLVDKLQEVAGGSGK